MVVLPFPCRNHVILSLRFRSPHFVFVPTGPIYWFDDFETQVILLSKNGSMNPPMEIGRRRSAVVYDGSDNTYFFSRRRTYLTRSQDVSHPDDGSSMKDGLADNIAGNRAVCCCTTNFCETVKQPILICIDHKDVFIFLEEE